MPMRYAEQADVLTQLEIEDIPDNTSVIERIERVENGLAAAFDQKIGRSFGVTPEAETRTVDVRRCSTTRLILPTSIRSISSISVGGTWDGSTWLASTTVPVSQYQLILKDHDGAYWGIDRIGYFWNEYESLRITGIWEDQVTLEIPIDVREAMTFIVVDEWRARNASPAGVIGPDELMVRVRNPWNFELVKEAIDRHRVGTLIV